MTNVKNFNEIKLSEEYHADLFEFCLKYRAFEELPNFDNILREIPCKQGVADFICYNDTGFLRSHSEQIYRINDKIGKTFIPVVAALLSNDNQCILSISSATGYDNKRLNKIIKVLKEEKVVKENQLLQYSLYANWKKFDIELWAFELKLKNWKRALYQAAQYQSFTSNVFTVFPMKKRELICSNLDVFKRLGVGCILQDSDTKMIEILYRPNNTRVVHNSPYLFALTEAIIKKETVG